MAQQMTTNLPSKLKGLLAVFSSVLLIAGIAVTSSSDESSAAPVMTPGRVKGVVATPGNESVTVSWLAPNFVGTSTINSYVVTSEDGPFGCSTTSSTSCTITGLTNGTGYRFTVTAVNSSGSSSPSPVSKLVTPLTVSSPPQSVSTIAGIKTVKVSWSAPGSNGGSTIKSYLVTSIPENKTCKSTLLPTCTVRGLTAGVKYVFSVTAINKAGSSPLAFSSEVAPLSAPSAPTTVTSSRESGLIRVSWGVPQSDGGSPIQSYRVTSTPSGYSCTTTITSCSFTAINNGSIYTFSVVANNAIGRSLVGRSDGSITSSVTSHPPTNVQAYAGENQATVSWSAPLINGGSAIANYTVTSSPGGFTCTSSSTQCVVTGLKNYLSYTFTVTATNSAGTSNKSASSAAVIPGSKTVNGYLVYPGANLASANLQGANLGETNLAGINLAGANLTGANLAGTNLTGSNLAGANLTDCVLAHANLIGANLIGSNLIRTSITGVNLSGTNLSFTNLSGTDLSGTNLTGTNLTGSNLMGVNLYNSNLTGTNLSGTDLSNIRSGLIQGTPLSLPSPWKLESGYLVGPTANLTWANLTNANLSGATLTDANLENANLSHANLFGANLSQSNMKSANLKEAVLSYAIITNAYLFEADLSQATLHEANLEGSHLAAVEMSSAILTQANLREVNLYGANLTLTNFLEANLTRATLDTAVLYESNLFWANLSEASFVSSDLAGANLTSANLSNANLRYGVLAGANLSSANLSGTDLRAANLMNAAFVLANLNSAKLEGAYIQGANFDFAALGNIRSGYVHGIPDRLPTFWQLINGFLVGPGADLSGADLGGAFLESATLDSANLENANLEAANLGNASLRNVKSGGIIGTPAMLPTDWKIVNGYLVGPEVDLSNEFLEYADLSFTNLEGANLSGAQINFSNLSFTNLAGANLSGAQFYSGDFYGSYMVEANLSGARFIGSNFQGLTLVNADMSFAYFSAVNFADSNLSGANFMGAYLQNSVLAWTNLTGANLTGANVSWVSLFQANLTNADFTIANLEGSNLVEAILDGTIFEGANLAGTYF